MINKVDFDKPLNIDKTVKIKDSLILLSTMDGLVIYKFDTANVFLLKRFKTKLPPVNLLYPWQRHNPYAPTINNKGEVFLQHFSSSTVIALDSQGGLKWILNYSGISGMESVLKILAGKDNSNKVRIKTMSAGIYAVYHIQFWKVVYCRYS